MYKEHFGLSQDPFSIAPDPNFLYLSDVHNEALAHLMYGFSHGGFVLITGEVGTGKTTLLRNLIDRIPAELDVAFVLNPRLTVRELLETLCDELGVRYTPGELDSIKQYIDALNKHLLKTHQSGRSTVVIIDEAQNLSPAVLEQIRLLTNLETNEKKLLRIILLGQPELADMLATTELRQLAQRITARYHLSALQKDDVRLYVNHRLARADGSPAIFSDKAINSLFRASNGIPRLINVIADRAMLGAYVEGKHQIEPDLIHRSAREVLGTKSDWKRKYPIGSVLGTMIVAAAIVVVASWIYFAFNNTPDTLQQAQSNSHAESKVVPNLETTFRTSDDGSLEQAQSIELVDDLPMQQTRPADSNTTEPASSQSGQTSAETNKTVSNDAGNSLPDANEPVNIQRPDRSSFVVRRLAYRALLNAWRADYPIQSQSIPCDFAPQVGLQCLGRRGGWSELRQLNTPVVLELWDTQSTPFYAALLSIEGSRIELELAGEKLIVSQKDLRDMWFGAYVIMWQTPPQYNGSLRKGDTHPTVGWLRSRLASIPSTKPLTTQATASRTRQGEQDYFDDTLADTVLEFQRQNALLADGIVGPLTWITLSEQLNLPSPKLIVATQ